MVRAVAKNIGGKAAVTGHFPGLKRNKIDCAVAKLSGGKPLERMRIRLITSKEELEICNWNSNTAPLKATSVDIIKVLKARFLFNMSKRFR